MSYILKLENNTQMIYLTVGKQDKRGHLLKMKVNDVFNSLREVEC